MMNNIIQVHCNICDKDIPIELKLDEPESKKTLQPAIPDPRKKSKKIVKYIDHDEHIVEVEIENGKVVEINYLEMLSSTLDNLARDNLIINNLINEHLKNENVDTTPAILFITKSPHYLSFLQKNIRFFLKKKHMFSINKTKDRIFLEFDEVLLIVSDSLSGLNLNGDNIMKTKLHDSNSYIRSLIIDTTSFTQDEVSDYLSNNVKLNSELRVILAFNTRSNRPPPIELRNMLEDKYEISHIDLLNFDEIKGLRFLNLQSYYNLVDDEFDIREKFEKIINKE